MPRPHRRSVFADGWDTIEPVKLLQRHAGTHAAGQELGLTLGHRALDAGRRRHGAALEVIGNQ
jgi:hypothetical protein